MIESSIRTRVGSFTLSADLKDGGFICLAGRNGSGKSCFLKAMSGQLQIDEGYVRVGGTDVTRLPVEHKGIVMVTPGSAIPHMKVDSHLRWGAKIRKVPLDEGQISNVKSVLGIDYGGRVRTLSLGMRERVSLATALLSRPRAIFVDEAFSNLHEKEAFIGSYRKLAAESEVDVIFSTQDESDARLADHLYVMSEGKTVRRQ